MKLPLRDGRRPPLPTSIRALLKPGSGILGQGTRFALAGSAVTLVYLSVTILLASAVGLPFQAALAIGFCVGLVVHFTLQRTFVWTGRGEFTLPLYHQVGRYLLLSATQYGVTAASTSLLPAPLGIATEIVYLATVAVLTATNFVIFRNGIFHARPADAVPTPEVDARVRRGSGSC